MLSVPLVRMFFLLFLSGLVIGCMGSVEVKKDMREPEVLIDSVGVKVAVAKMYILEGEETKAREALEDAQKDIELSQLNQYSALGKQEENALLKTKEDIGNALYHLGRGDFLDALSSLEVAEGRLTKVNNEIRGIKEISPPRFSVELREIPITYYGSVDGEYLGYQVVPHSVAAAAREAFYSYQKTGDEEALNQGLFLTDYLISTATVRGDGKFVVWENNFVWPPYNLSKGWIGALSQAGCLKALMLAYEATGDPRYREKAEKALAAFEVDVSDGGLRVLRADESGVYVWYPEYAKPEPPYVLNGFITSVVWLRDYYISTGDGRAKSLYDNGLQSIVHYLPSYRYKDNWSYYDAAGHKASRHYHDLHVKQMAVLYELSGEDIFKEYQETWGGGVAEK